MSLEFHAKTSINTALFGLLVEQAPDIIDTKHNNSEKTILHNVCDRTNLEHTANSANYHAATLPMLKILMKANVNPFLRDRQGRRAYDIASDPAVRAALLEYMVAQYQIKN